MFPILLAAARFGLAGAAVTAVVACLVAGPLLPLDVATGARQHLLDWSGRLGFFLGIGLVMGAVIVRLKGSLEREIALAREDGYLALRESEAMLRAVFAASPDIITMVKADGELAPPSAAVREILGYEPAEYAQMDRISLIHPDDRERVNESLRSLLQGGPPVELRFRMPHADGHWVVLESHSRGMTDPERRPSGLVAVARDVTEKVTLEDALRSSKKEAERAREDAERANRAKSEFLSRMSHELRTPLNAILGFGQLLEMDGLEPQHQESVEQILKGGKHLLDLINEVLDIARIESGRITLSLEPIVLADAMGEAIHLIQPLAAEQGIELKSDDAWPADGYVRADRQRLKQVLLNLLSNAVKYNRPGGRVTVRCMDVRDEVRIQVSDQGVGIPPERMDRLFVPFERLGAEGTAVEGTGLGLALSKGLTEAMGGRLGVKSAVGQGSTFFVQLPLAQAPGIMVEGKEAVDRTFLLAPAGAHMLLYIEDNLANLKLIEGALNHRPGLILLNAMQGSLGLDLARQHQPDLILLDLHLPDMPGEEVLRHLQGDPTTQGIPVIVISADATPGQIRNLLDAGARAYLTKPIDVSRFFEAVDEALAERRLDNAG